LTPAAIESVLDDFRSWLEHLRSSPPAEQEPKEPAQLLDLHTLLGQSIALRQEVNLQTKAARAQQELSASALQELSEALEAVRQAQAAAHKANQQAEEEVLRPLLKTLLDVHDAFCLAEREIRRAPENILSVLHELVFEMPSAERAEVDGEPGSHREPILDSETDPDREAEAAPEPASAPKKSLWQRLFGRGRRPSSAPSGESQSEVLEQLRALYERLLSSQRESARQEQAARQELREKIKQVTQRVEQLLDSVLTGYRMSLQRLERALEKSGLEPIRCVGQPFDPEQMEVVATVADSGRSGGEVIEEVRRGYLWHGRVFRYAQVSVAKS
jgi:molecular chaperone GrpE (heat shock protein)